MVAVQIAKVGVMFKGFSVSAKKIAELEKRAVLGDADAQYQFGTINLFGVIYNPDAGLEWYRRAAAQGHSGAMRSLAYALYDDSDVRSDWPAALELAIHLGEQGDMDMLLFAAKMYIEGRGGLERNFVKAYEFAHRVVEKGCPHAQVFVGDMCRDGLGVERDLGKAVHLYRAAAAQYSLLGRSRLEELEIEWR